MIFSARKGFTLIELLVVISIIATLGVIGVIIFTNVLNKVRDTKVTADFDAMYKNIEQARIIQQKVLGDITGNYCSECSCRTSVDDPLCLSTMTTSYGKVTYAPLPKDPWGSIYMWDENEGEVVHSGCGFKDFIRTVGPDHQYGTGDDRIYVIPFGGYTGCQ